MNKIGAKNNNVIIWIVGILIVLVFVGVIDVSGIFGKKDTVPLPTPSGVDCQIAPALAFSVVNAEQKGTPVTTVQGIRLNGVLLAGVPTTLQYDDEVEIFYNATNYISNVGPKHKMTCGINTLTNEIYATNNPTIRIFNSDGTRVGDSVTADCAVHAGVNQSESATAVNMKMEIQSAPLQSSGDLLVIVEANNNTQVGYSDITLSGTGVTDATVPSFYTQNATGSAVRAFNVPASVNGALNTYYINLNPRSGITLGANADGLYAEVTTLSKQAFVDTDGIFRVGVENKNGVFQYEDLTDHGICINN